MNNLKFQYAKGHPIPEHVIAALVFTGKTGFLNFDTWSKCFAAGSERWKKMHFDYLTKEGYFAKHRNPEAETTRILGLRGRMILERINASVVTSPPVGHLTHDGVVNQTMQTLDSNNLINTWLSERELKRDGVKDYLISTKDDTTKYPDAVFTINAFGKERVVAFEYERERKALARYKAILWQYACLSNVSMVLFVYERSNIKTTIEAAMKYLGQTGLSDRLAFVSSEEWRRDPVNAAIQLGGTTISFGKICAIEPSNKAA